jgi:hypothetical protein
MVLVECLDSVSHAENTATTPMGGKLYDVVCGCIMKIISLRRKKQKPQKEHRNAQHTVQARISSSKLSIKQ